MRPDTERYRQLPRKIGKYRVLARLGEGATSEVFHARDDFHRRDVAIKCVRPPSDIDASGGDSQFYERFFAAEAALVGRLEHPNVVQIYDAVADVESPHLVMEYVPGTTLKSFCRADALLSLEQIVEIGFKCAMALGYVARQGLIHRDVKPANLLAVMDGEKVIDVKVSDFGSVLQLDADRTQVQRVGSLAYMSPEQLDGAELDTRADMYSLAAVLYHLIAGRPPFEGPTQAALMQQVFNEAPAPLAALRAGVPDSLDALVRGALAKQPAERPADWDAFAQSLAGVIARREVPRGRVQGVLDSERFSLLRSLEFFGAFGDVELWEVVHRAKWQRFAFGHTLYRKGQEGGSFHILAAGEVEVFRDGRKVAELARGTSVGEMAYLAPSEELRLHRADVIVSQPCTTISFTPQTLAQLTMGTRHRFDDAFIKVLVRRLHAAHEALDHPRRIL
ncbi:MAG: serine/threonine-protein kinase [Aquincola sp.]|nr:serine/threonine-protein kinase [Aquincola sp.]MDH4287518.1 serine/threonine-protein kinase [Aquincola sp.]MDH5328874.1 serine/threonine-protein kinase [Aquincola sp.]